MTTPVYIILYVLACFGAVDVACAIAIATFMLLGRYLDRRKERRDLDRELAQIVGGRG